jgi:hypothetical protein
MSEIIVSSIGRSAGTETFHVEIRDGGSSIEHEVTLTDAYWSKLTGGSIPKTKLVRMSFAFLLEREAKESILNAFDLPLISKYFPEYEGEIRTRLESLKRSE